MLGFNPPLFLESRCVLPWQSSNMYTLQFIIASLYTFLTAVYPSSEQYWVRLWNIQPQNKPKQKSLGKTIPLLCFGPSLRAGWACKNLSNGRGGHARHMTEAVASLLRISTKTSWSCLGAQRCHRPKWKNDRLFSQELQQQTEGPKSFFPEVKRDLGRWWNFKSSVHSFTRSAMEEECPQARPLAPSLDKSHSSLLCSQISDLFQN